VTRKTLDIFGKKIEARSFSQVFIDSHR
jgi:hypothetical protein